MTVHQLHGDLVVTSVPDTSQSLDEFLACPAHGGCADEVRRQVGFIRPDKHQVATVVGQVLCICWLVFLMDGEVSRGEITEGALGQVATTHGTDFIRQVVEHDSSQRRCFRHQPRFIGIVSIEHSAQEEEVAFKVVRVPARPGPYIAHLGQAFLGTLRTKVQPARIELCGHLFGFRTKRREPQRNLLAQVNEFQVRVQEGNLSRLLLDGPVDGFTSQQGLHRLNVSTCFRERDGTQSHGPTRGKTGANAKIDPARRKLRNGCQCVCRHRLDAIGRHQDPGTKTDTGCFVCGECHAHKHIGIEKLGIVKPRRMETEFLGPFYMPPGIDL